MSNLPTGIWVPRLPFYNGQHVDEEQRENIGHYFLKRQDLSKMDKKTLKIYRLEENNEA